MKQDKKEKRNNILYSVLGFVLGIAMCGIGIYGMILNRIESQEYKNTTDKTVKETIGVGVNEKAALSSDKNCPFVYINFDFTLVNKVASL